jgi:hypothetical protein
LTGHRIWQAALWSTPSLASTPVARPAQQIPVRGFETLVKDRVTAPLLASIERKTWRSKAKVERDC